MNLLLDLALVLIALICAIFGYKRGALATFFSLISGVAAIVLAFLLASPVGDFLNDQIVKPAISAPVAERITESLAEGSPSAQAMARLFASPPKDLSDLFSVFGANADTVSVSEGDTAKSVAASIVHPVSRAISCALAFIALFLVLGIVIRLLIRFARRFNHVPLIGTVNRVAGLAIGLVEGLVLAWVFCAVVAAAVPYLVSLEHPFFSKIDLSSTYLFQFVYRFDPLTLLNGFGL